MTFDDELDSTSYPIFKINQKIDEILRKFILDGGFEV